MLGVIITLLAFIVLKEERGQFVNAQGQGYAGHVFGLIGKKQGNREPLYIVDTQAQIILVYEYAPQGEGLGLVSARSYKHDKQLEHFGRYHGPGVDAIQAELLKPSK